MSKTVRGPHQRRCWDCESIAIHEDNITPHVLCKKCGSQDTRLVVRNQDKCEHIINAHGQCQWCHAMKKDLEYEAMKKRLLETEEVFIDDVDGIMRWVGSGKSVYYG